MLDRDIRLSESQINYTSKAVRYRLRHLDKSIETALRNRSAGQTIQHGTLDANLRERDELRLVRDALEVARKQIARRIEAAATREHGERRLAEAIAAPKWHGIERPDALR